MDCFLSLFPQVEGRFHGPQTQNGPQPLGQGVRLPQDPEAFYRRRPGFETSQKKRQAVILLPAPVDAELGKRRGGLLQPTQVPEGMTHDSPRFFCCVWFESHCEELVVYDIRFHVLTEYKILQTVEVE